MWTTILAKAFGVLACALFRWPCLDGWIDRVQQRELSQNLSDIEWRVMHGQPYPDG